MQLFYTPVYLLIWIYDKNWLQIYLERRFIVGWSMFLKSAVQVALLLGALYTAATRVTDNQHHLDDVIAGCALGVVFAVWAVSVVLGFPQLLKNHWNSDLFQDHGKIIEFYEKFLKFVKMKKSWKNHWISDQLLMEKSLNSEIDMVLSNYMGK